MEYNALSKLILDANKVYEESFVVTTGETEGFYALSMFDAVRQVVGPDDQRTFELVYYLLSNSKEQILQWATNIQNTPQ